MEVVRTKVLLGELNKATWNQVDSMIEQANLFL
jgi:hypothetical protein